MGRERELPFSYGADRARRGNDGDETSPGGRPRNRGEILRGAGTRPSRQGDARRQPERPALRRRRWGQRLLLGTGLASVLVLVAAVGIALYALVSYLNIERIGDLGVDAAAPDEPRNYLVVGSDERQPGDGSGVEGRRSDTLMLVRVDPSGGEAATLSIPRDLVVPIAGTGDSDRINSAYAIDRTTLLDTVRDALDIEIHHYAEVDFASFETLVDALGGVDIWIDQPIKDDRSGLLVDELGCVTLDGPQALAFVRSRQLQYSTSAGTWSTPDPTADHGRMARQQVFVSQAVTEALSQVRSDPARLPEMVDVVTSSLAIDDQMSIQDLLAIAEALEDLEPDELRTYTLPVEGRSDGATVELHEDESDAVLDHFRDSADSGDTGSDSSAASGSSDGGSSGETSDASAPELVLGEPPAGQSC